MQRKPSTNRELFLLRNQVVLSARAAGRRERTIQGGLHREPNGGSPPSTPLSSHLFPYDAEHTWVCRDTDSVSVAAQLMREHELDCVPVVDATGRRIGVVTERDICMAALAEGKALTEITAGSVCSH